MKKLNLLSKSELPDGFTYPKQLQHILDLELTNLEPWYFLEGTALREAVMGLARRYPDRELIPFARRQDNDDIACWEAQSNDEVFIVHDFASAGWEQHGRFASFYDWFRRAIEDLIDFHS